MNDKPPLPKQIGLILESVGEGIHVLDADGLTIYENAASAAILGRSAERLVGQRGHDRLHSRRADGSVYPLDECPIHKTLHDGMTRRVSDEVFWNAAGSPVPVSYVCAPLRDETGAVNGAVVSFHDITDLLRSETALRQRESQQRELARQLETERARLVAAQTVAKVGSWETSLATMAVIWSHETHRIFETDPDTFRPTHQDFLKLVHPEDRNKVDAAFAESLNNHDSHALEHRVILADGRIKIVEEQWRAFADDNGRFVRAIGTCQDVTERRRTETLLRDSEEKFSKLFESSPAKIAIGRLDGTLVDVNQAYAEFLGFTREEMIGKTIAELGVVSSGELNRLLSLGRAPGNIFRDEEVLMKTRAGAHRHVLLTAELIVLAGAPHRVATLVDITDRKSAEEERRNLHEQALRAQRMASIGTLAGGIAHDLNNMLSPIAMSIQLLRQKFQDDDSQQILAVMQDSAQRSSDMVNRVLSFARGVDGRREAVDVAAVARDVRNIARDSFPKSIEVLLSAADDLWSVIGDQTQLHQVLLNLCVNARDAMPEGGRITIRLENTRIDKAAAAKNPDAKPGDHVRISVEDEGTGIPPEIRERIFEPFFTTKSLGHGTGLGLSTSLAIVKSHGGFISIGGAQGGGAQFHIFLPATALAPAPPRATPEPSRGAGELVLVVDDEEAIRSMLKRTLERFGYRVLLAADGRQALSLYTERAPDISAVLTDMAMPHMDGSALISALVAQNPKLTIIASSGRTTEGELERAAGVRVPHFLAKPYTAEALLHLLRQALDKR